MIALLRFGAMFLIAGGVLAESRRVVPAPGLALALALSLAAYLWFLAAARRTTQASQRRRG